MVKPENLQPSGEQATLYLRSYLGLRFAIGVFGLALPLVLLIGDIWLSSSPTARGSISAYYHSGMRDVFVGILVATGVFLITYRVVNHKPTNVITTVAGVACIGVGIFPTVGATGTPLTPLQDLFGADQVRVVHFASAGVFICLLGVISIIFAREAQAKAHMEGTNPRWVGYHYACAAAIFVAVLYILATKTTGVGDAYSLLIGETVAVLAFGASWLSKGLALHGEVLKSMLPPALLPKALQHETAPKAVSPQALSSQQQAAHEAPPAGGSGDREVDLSGAESRLREQGVDRRRREDPPR